MFHFKPLQPSDLPLLFEWLSLPHVAAWWREAKNYKQFAKKYNTYITASDVGPYIIYHNEHLVGFIQWYDAATCSIENETFPERTYGMDFFIANIDYLGKGYGAQIIQQFIKDIIMPKNPAKIIIDPEITNTKAIHVYEKVGFKKTNVVQTTDGTQMVTAQLMELDPGD